MIYYFSSFLFATLLLTSSCQATKKKRKKTMNQTQFTKQKQSSINTAELLPAPKTVEQYNEIAIKYNETVPELYNSLSPEERVFIYYIFRASLPGNYIAADQMHRYSNEIREIFETIYNNKEKLASLDSIDYKQFIKDVKTFLVYLWTNHGQYFMREHSDEKRTPDRLGLKTLTQENVTYALNHLDYNNAEETLHRLAPVLFDRTIEATCTVPDSINQSACNIYSHDFTDDDYETIPADMRNKINAYFYIDQTDGKHTPSMASYSANEKYGKELQVSFFWLQKAYEHAQKHPQYFDKHLTKSLDYMLQFLDTGDEELFKKHSIEWLKSSSRVDYNFGFIEVYDDPKARRGSFQADITIKSIDINKLNTRLPSVEKELPFPKEFQREAITSMPNASINAKLFGAGHLGPMFVTAAYCLPNYEEIRSEHGSKQIIYPSSKGLGSTLNPELSRNLFNLKKEAAWLKENDPDNKLSRDLWDAHCILHETIGHGSGRLATHTFQANEPLTIGDKTYTIGDTIKVTSDNISQFLSGYMNTIEEMRAEILALYVSINNLDTLVECDLLKDWYDKLGEEELTKHLIIHMATTGLNRILQQSDNATEITGAHAQANCTITNYLVDSGALEIAQETFKVENKEHTVLGIRILDLDLAKEKITELARLVQHIKSTGDGIAAHTLVEAYGRPLKHPEYLVWLKENQKAVVGDLKCSAVVHPQLIPVADNNGALLDVKATWPKDIFEQQEEYQRISLKTV